MVRARAPRFGSAIAATGWVIMMLGVIVFILSVGCCNGALADQVIQQEADPMAGIENPYYDTTAEHVGAQGFTLMFFSCASLTSIPMLVVGFILRSTKRVLRCSVCTHTLEAS